MYQPISQSSNSLCLYPGGKQYEFTKMMTPLASRSYVLANPESYEYFLSRYAQFSYLDAYNTTSDGYLDDDNVIYICILSINGWKKS